ncbi:MAG: type I-B CRISPR-associated endonuclease Cas1b [Candidatus Omnitrophica bacterium]|nr:type I-B CRISPR-associated endonuclease Cas1b [Candidatus Omnitrophota bacterium]
MKTYYIFSNGVLRRKENTIVFETSENEKKFIPVENVEQIFVFGEVDFNNKFLNFIGQNNICLHIFNYYGWYSGTFYPRETNISGTLIVEQVKHYLEFSKRLVLAKKFIEGAIHNIKRNLQKKGNLKSEEDKVVECENLIESVDSIPKLMSLEAQVRKIYYGCFEKLTGWNFEERSIQPPKNPLNALISFGNSLVYSIILKEIYLTPLSPFISFLHEPGERRYSLALDVSEIFKPILSDKLIIKLIDLKIIKEDNFVKEMQGVYLNEEGRKVFIEEFDKQLETTVLHRKLRKKVKYKTLIKLELYKLIKHLLGEKEYQPLKVWW